MEDVKQALLQVINTRRSTRSYLPDPLSGDLLNTVIEAGRMAPSGNNNQSTHFIVVSKPEALAELRATVTSILASTPVREGMAPPFVAMIKKAREEIVDINYGAPVLILTANKKGYDNAVADCACALENMMLTAAACGLGSCWINQYYLLRAAPPLRACLEKFGLREDEEVCGAMILGHSDKIPSSPLPRKGNPVTLN